MAQQETHAEWESLIGSSCGLSGELTNALSEELAFWNPWGSPLYLLSDSERLIEFEGLVRPSLALNMDAPTDAPGLVRYRFEMAAKRLALADGPAVDDPSLIDSCAGEVYGALAELEEETEALVRRALAEEGIDFDEFEALLRVDSD